MRQHLRGPGVVRVGEQQRLTRHVQAEEAVSEVTHVPDRTVAPAAAGDAIRPSLTDAYGAAGPASATLLGTRCRNDSRRSASSISAADDSTKSRPAAAAAAARGSS